MKCVCNQCNKEFNGRKENKFCSRQCANEFRKEHHNSHFYEVRKCELCKSEFEVLKKSSKRFCSTRCSAIWRQKTFGYAGLSEQGRQSLSNSLSARWKDEEFRNKKINYMKTNNPVYIPGVVEKANKTRYLHSSYTNNFKYGNGKISEYEQVVFKLLEQYNFVYNYSINTKLARDAFPDRKYAYSYKPDFVNLALKLCIEIDGKSHTVKHVKELDNKKRECLQYLGFTIIRFTHTQIDKGELIEWLNLNQEKLAVQ